MKCILCEKYSLTHICKSCQTNFLTPTLYKRTLINDISVISFYKYDEIKELLFTKHTDIGFYVYTILAKLSFKKFAEEFHTKEHYASIAVDDNPKSGYSHTAILNHALKSYNISPQYSKLRAKSTISYSGKTRAFREQNPRNFQLKKFKNPNVILVDDIITTGTTLREAIKLLEQKEKQVAFCLTLCDVSISG